MAVALKMPIPVFVVSPLTFQTPCLIFSKFSLKITCNVIPTKQSQSLPQAERVKVERQRRHNAMEQFLLEEAGLSSSQVTAVTSMNPSLLRSKSTDRAQEALQLFRDCGFTSDQLRKIILRDPYVLARKVDKQLKPKIELFKSLGLAEEDVARVLTLHPRILSVSLDNNLNPTSLLLLTLFGSKENVSKAIRKAPGLFAYGFEALKQKLTNMESVGLQQHEIKELLEKDPRFLYLSIDKIQKNMDFLTHTAGFPPNIVLKYPVFLNFSIERRMKPRYKLFEYLNGKNCRRGLVYMLSISEQYFTERFLNGNPEVTKLYENCKGKSVNVETN